MWKVADCGAHGPLCNPGIPSRSLFSSFVSGNIAGVWMNSFSSQGEGLKVDSVMSAAQTSPARHP